jgi:hypothetical protein
MEEYPGLGHIKANNEVISEIEDDFEYEITVVAHQQEDVLRFLESLGWVIRAKNVFVWPKYLLPMKKI